MPTLISKILENKGRDVVHVDAAANVQEAAELMHAEKIGALVVTDGEKVVGIFTERDILNRVVAMKLDPAATRVNQVMTAPIACCGPDTDRAECRAVMKRRRLRHLPVVQGERLVGIVSIGDLLEDEGAERDAALKNLYEYMSFEWDSDTGR